MISTALWVFLAFVVVLAVHEVGHYLAGRVAGIPARCRRFVVLALPPHVALYDGETWVSPFQTDRFSTAYGLYDPSRRYSRLFTAGGFLAQVAVLVPAALVLGSLTPELGITIASVSLWFVLGYLAMDVVATPLRGRAFGDSTHLWRLHPPTAVAVLGLVVFSHVGALALLR